MGRVHSISVGNIYHIAGENCPSGLDPTTTSSLVKLVSSLSMLRVVLRLVRGSDPHTVSIFPGIFYIFSLFALIIVGELALAPAPVSLGLLPVSRSTSPLLTSSSVRGGFPPACLPDFTGGFFLIDELAPALAPVSAGLLPFSRSVSPPLTSSSVRAGLPPTCLPDFTFSFSSFSLVVCCLRLEAYAHYLRLPRVPFLYVSRA